MINELWIVPPIATARLGSSDTPCANFPWGPSDTSPGGTGKTTLSAQDSLELTANGEVQLVPAGSELIFKDQNASGRWRFRPVCPYFEPDRLAGTGATFCVAPSYTVGAFTPKRLAIGDALMTLDPLCGDGVGHGVKSAVLAVAVANSASAGVSEDAAIAHYRSRAVFAFRTHLRHCRDYYSSIRHPEYWRSEVEAIDAAESELDLVDDNGAGLTPIVSGLDGTNPSGADGLSIRLAAVRQD